MLDWKTPTGHVMHWSICQALLWIYHARTAGHLYTSPAWGKVSQGNVLCYRSLKDDKALTWILNPAHQVYLSPSCGYWALIIPQSSRGLALPILSNGRCKWPFEETLWLRQWHKALNPAQQVYSSSSPAVKALIKPIIIGSSCLITHRRSGVTAGHDNALLQWKWDKYKHQVPGQSFVQ